MRKNISYHAQNVKAKIFFKRTNIFSFNYELIRILNFEILKYDQRKFFLNFECFFTTSICDGFHTRLTNIGTYISHEKPTNRMYFM